MRIVFIGGVKFSKSALEHLLNLGLEIVGVCTQNSSNVNSDWNDLGEICINKNIPVNYPLNINSPENVNWIKELNPDIIFCLGWSQLIKKEILELPKIGVIGYHPSDLPKNRGRHPITWALALGLDKIGSCFFVMDEGIDSGDIISKKMLDIELEDDAATLYEKITHCALEQLSDLVPKLLAKNFERIPQDQRNSNIWRKRTDKDRMIDWRMSAFSIHNLVRSLAHPYIGAQFIDNGQFITAWKTSIQNNHHLNYEPGKVIERNFRGTVIKCGDGSILLEITEPENWIPSGDYL